MFFFIVKDIAAGFSVVNSHWSLMTLTAFLLSRIYYFKCYFRKKVSASESS